MSAESRSVRTESWENWERLVIKGVYPLRRFLGGSDHSAVFLTEYKAEGLANAAIKFLPADPSQVEAQLVQWGTAATLSHPHLIRLFDVGRCQIGGRAFLFVVMEYADQTLAQILPKRALSADEVLQLLPPTLEAMAFLHRNYLVQGQLKPSNFLVVDDKLKLASDTVRPIGNSTTSPARTSSYDPPELRESGSSAAGDVWGLGITLVESLTQRAPAWGEDRSETASLLTAIPPPFAETVLRCLSRAPQNRPTVMELEAQYDPAVAQAAEASASAHAVESEAQREAPARERSIGGPLLVAMGVAVLITSLAVWVGLPPFDRATDFQHETPPPAITPSSQTSPAGSTPDAPVEHEAVTAESAPPSHTAVSQDATPEAVVSPPTQGVTSQASASPPSQDAPSQAVPSPTRQDAPSQAVPSPTRQSATPQAPASPSPQSTAHKAVTSPLLQALDSRRSLEPTAAPAQAALPPPVGVTSAQPQALDSQHSREPASARTQAVLSPPRAATLPASPSPSRPPASVATPDGVLHREMPDIPRAIREKIRGHVNVVVRVLVDPSGNVVGEFLENAGPSRYFARQAGDAAGKWQFASTESPGSRVWMLRFEFTREGATVRVSNAQ